MAVLTTGRQDYGILRSSLMLLREDPRFALEVWAGGMHLLPAFGHTIDLVRADGLAIAEELPFSSDERPTPVSEAARATDLVGAALARRRPDALVLLGDRSETLAAGVAAAVQGVPLVHLHGGEESEGATDNACRHALTKLSHLHLVSHDLHARRVLQMGEDPATVVVVGAPGLDNLHRADLPTRDQLEGQLGIPLAGPLVVVTVHPTTLGGAASPTAEVEAVAAAMAAVPATYVVTHPNSDAGGDAIRAFWLQWATPRSNIALVAALGERSFWGLLRVAAAVLGNSSSGIIEAPAAGLPVVNVGERQRGRLRSPHVIDAPAEAPAIEAALRGALEPSTRERLRGASPPYPAGPAAPRVVEALASWRIPRPPVKRFHEVGT